MTTELTPPPGRGRTFTVSRRVRLGDTTPDGRLRLDALVRYLQDVSGDDTTDAGVGDDGRWIVRRTVVAVERWPRYQESVELTTWCAGIGSRWAERRVSITGEHGGAAEAATLWVHLGDDNLPALLPQEFFEVFGESAGDREVTTRLAHPRPPRELQGRSWPLRAVDLDVLRHVNNAAYWAVVEEEMVRRDDLAPPFVIEMEHRMAMLSSDEVELRVQDRDDGGLSVWVVVDGKVKASARLTPGDADQAGS